MRVIKKHIIHCSASNLPEQGNIAAIKELHTASKTKKFKWGIYDTHGREFKDVGYHFFIRKDGTLEYGRSIMESGAHCKGHNHDSIGTCLEGYLLEDFTQEQKMTLYKLCRSLVTIFPNITTHGHNEFANKACPVMDISAYKVI